MLVSAGQQTICPRYPRGDGASLGEVTPLGQWAALPGWLGAGGSGRELRPPDPHPLILAPALESSAPH